MNHSKALDRVKKLLRLARDPGASAAEAESALLQAQRIMAENGLEDGALADTPAPEDLIRDDGVADVRRKEFWRGRLAVAIARNFRCKMYWMNHGGGRATLHFLGRHVDVEIAKEVFTAALEVALLQVKTFLKANRGGLRTRNAFLAGFADGLAAKYDEQVQHARSTGTAMVVVADPGVEAQFKTLRLRSGPRSTADLSDTGARAAGTMAGRTFDLRRKVASKGPIAFSGG